MWDLFAFCPTPEAGRDADQKEIETIITPLGLYKKRAAIFKRFCKEYIEKEVRVCGAKLMQCLQMEIPDL